MAATRRATPEPIVRLKLKVTPGSPRDAIAGWLGDVLKLRVRAPAERGKANAAVEELVARELGLSTERVRIVSGRTSPRKGIEVSGLAEAEIHRRLAKPEG